MMGRLRVTALVLAVVFAVGTVGVSAVMAQPKIPPPLTFEKGKDSPGTVTFDHEKHKEKVDKCTACHTKIFKMKKGQSGQLTMAKMKAGEQCGSCHNGKTEVGGTKVFAADDKANCEKCHKK